MSVKTIKLSTFSEIWHRGSEQTGPSGSNKRKEEYETPENVDTNHEFYFFILLTRQKEALYVKKKRAF